MRLIVVSVWVRCVMVSVPQVEHLQAAALHDPTEPLYHVHMAGLLTNAGHLADAQRHAEAAIDRNPQDPSPHLLLASVLASQLQQARASPHATVQAMRRKLHQALAVAHDLDPHNPRTCLRLAMLGLDFSRLSAEDVLGRSASNWQRTTHALYVMSVATVGGGGGGGGVRFANRRTWFGLQASAVRETGDT